MHYRDANDASGEDLSGTTQTLRGGDTLTVFAVPDPGYKFHSTATTDWPFTSADEHCVRPEKPTISVQPTCAVVDGTVTIPSTPGVVYWNKVTGEPLTTDTVSIAAGSSITITATPASGYIFDPDVTVTEWPLTADTPTCTEVEPQPPKFVQPTCARWGLVQVPAATDQVKYLVDGVDRSGDRITFKVGDTVAVQAVLMDPATMVFAPGKTSWSEKAAAPTCAKVEPQPPKFVQPTCAQRGLVQVPAATKQVKYLVDGVDSSGHTIRFKAGSTVTVQAVLKDPATTVFASKAETRWSKKAATPDCSVAPTGPQHVKAPTCSASGWVWIPDQRGVVYKVGGRPVSSDWVKIPAGGQITVKAYPARGYHFSSSATRSWTLPGRAPDCSVMPTGPKLVKAPTCSAPGSYRIPNDSHVTYKDQHGHQLRAGRHMVPAGTSVTVTAYADTDAGYSFPSDATTKWTIPSGGLDCTVMPTGPQQITAPTCSAPGSYRIPNDSHVTYKVDGKRVFGRVTVPAGKQVTVKAYPARGYHFDGDATRSWTLPKRALDCSVKPSGPQDVKAPTCSASGSFTIPADDHVTYWNQHGHQLRAGPHTVPAGGQVTVKAVLARGYHFDGDATRSWTIKPDKTCPKPVPSCSDHKTVTVTPDDLAGWTFDTGDKASMTFTSDGLELTSSGGTVSGRVPLAAPPMSKHNRCQPVVAQSGDNGQLALSLFPTMDSQSDEGLYWNVSGQQDADGYHVWQSATNYGIGDWANIGAESSGPLSLFFHGHRGTRLTTLGAGGFVVDMPTPQLTATNESSSTVTVKSITLGSTKYVFAPATVTPAKPTLTDNACPNPDTITIPSTEGVVYENAADGSQVTGKITIASGTSMTVIAKPATNYEFSGDQSPSWTFTAVPAGACPPSSTPSSPPSASTPSAGPAAASTGTLPKTGADGIGAIIVGAAALIGLGVALSRRRRTASR